MQSRKEADMTAVQMNADILRNIGIIAEDESMLAKLAKYTRKLANQMTYDPTCMSKEEFFAKLDRSERQIAEGKGRTFTDVEQMHAWLNSL